MLLETIKFFNRILFFESRCVVYSQITFAEGGRKNLHALVMDSTGEMGFQKEHIRRDQITGDKSSLYEVNANK
jgi:hypothetical protein